MNKFIKFLVVTVVFLSLASVTLSGVSTYLEPQPAISANATDGAIVRVYGADVWGVRGRFAIHTWVATKKTSESKFTIHEVIGWKLRRNGTALSVSRGNPNRPWFKSPAILLHEITGSEAKALIPAIRQAVYDYPYAEIYTMWPGPNSNSFTQWVALTVPELGLELPMKAIGKSWMTEHIGMSPSVVLE